MDNLKLFFKLYKEVQMIVDKVKKRDEFRLSHGTRVRITRIHEENDEWISLGLIRISGSLKGTRSSKPFNKTSDGKVDLDGCSDFTSR